MNIVSQLTWVASLACWSGYPSATPFGSKSMHLLHNKKENKINISLLQFVLQKSYSSNFTCWYWQRSNIRCNFLPVRAQCIVLSIIENENERYRMYIVIQDKGILSGR